MGGIISGVSAEAIAMVDERLGTEEKPSSYVLSPFNDPSTGPVFSTDDASAFKSALAGLGASGGEDCPELATTGILNAVAALDEGSDLFAFTDADAKDSGVSGFVSSLASSKDIRVYPLLFGSCSSSKRVEGRSSQARDEATGRAAAFTVDQAFTRVARATGGQVFTLAAADAGSITQLADALVRSNAVSVLERTVALRRGAHAHRRTGRRGAVPGHVLGKRNGSFGPAGQTAAP
jgi:hypothetical protein